MTSGGSHSDGCRVDRLRQWSRSVSNRIIREVYVCFRIVRKIVNNAHVVVLPIFKLVDQSVVRVLGDSPCK